MTIGITAFGAALDQPTRASAVLRARASAAGIALLPISDIDACAAVLSAHCWALATAHTSVAGTMTPLEASGLAPALARAAGHGERPTGPLGQWCSEVTDVPADLMARVAPVVAWARSRAGELALELAAYDLASCADERVAALAQHLASHTDVHLPG